MKLEDRKAGEREDRPTPETDGAKRHKHNVMLPNEVVPAFVCERLERQRDEAREAAAEWKGVAEMMSAAVTRFFAHQFGRLAEPMLGDELLAIYRERAADAAAEEPAS